MRFILAAAAIMSVLAPDRGAAQTPVALTVEEAIARALETSGRVAEAAARADAASFAAAGREAARLPQVAFLGGYARTSHVDEFAVPQPDGRLRVIFPDVPDNYRARLDLQWALYTGGRAESLAGAATAERDAAREEVSAARSDIRFETTRAYWTLVTARETVRVVGEAVARADTHLRDLRSRLAAGLIPPNDVLSAEAQRARQQVLLIEADNAREVAAADLRRLAGLPPDAELVLTSPLETGSVTFSGRGPAEQVPVPVSPGTVAFSDLLARAREARPERRALERRIEAARARHAAAAARQPTVAIAAGYDYARPNPRILPRRDTWEDSWDVAVNVGWALWDAGRGSAERGETAALELALEARLVEFDRALELELRQRRLDLAAARAAIGAAAQGVASAAEARRVVGERFAAGVVTSADVVDAQLALLQAELDRTRALAAARLAEARLARAIGGQNHGV